jgi:hypothetical protein
MIITRIHLSRKLEKQYKKYIGPEGPEGQAGLLGHWYAAHFHVKRKKYWLVTNVQTYYSVIMPQVPAREMHNFGVIFKERLCEQLAVDKIFAEYHVIDTLIGSIRFETTGDNRTTIGKQRNMFYNIEHWLNLYQGMDEQQMIEFNSRINHHLTHRGKGYKMSDFTDGRSEMDSALARTRFN